jgi:fatty acid desaturase
VETETGKRGSIPFEVFQRKPSVFVAKFTFAFAIVAGGWYVLAVQRNIVVSLVTMAVLGLIYAHLVELQHETLHHHAFRSRRLNRVFGFLCGVFLLSSYSHYRYEHLAHHANLGTSRNTEFFNYRFRNLDSWHGFFLAAMHPGRYGDVAKATGRALSGRQVIPDGRERENRKVRAEYLLMFAIAIVAAAASVIFGFTYLLVVAWVLPALVVGEAAHFLIEMPEHFGLNTQTDSNVLSNTRTIRAGRLGEWYTNFNNLHTAHHFHSGVPMVNARQLHVLVATGAQTIEPSYWSFYRNVVRGEIRYQDWSTTCMTR